MRLKISERNREVITCFVNAFIDIVNAKSLLALNPADIDLCDGLRIARHEVLSSPDSLSQTSSGWDILFGTLPSSIQETVYGEESDAQKGQSSFSAIKSLEFLNNSGFGIFIAEPVFVSSGKRSIHKHLGAQGYRVVAAFSLPDDVLKQLSPVLIVVAREQQGALFVAEIECLDQASDLVKAFHEKKESGNLIDGTFVDASSFKGFSEWKIRQQISALETEYKSFASKRVCDLTLEVNLGGFKYQVQHG